MAGENLTMRIFKAQFTNGRERRSTALLQPDIVFAMMAAQRWAPAAFAMPWNRVADKDQWKIVVEGKPGERYEERAQV